MDTSQNHDEHGNQDEFSRINDLYSYKVLDTPHEASFNQLARLASLICQTPIALISFIDRDRQWYKATVGLDLNEIPRYLSACNETIRRSGPYVLNAKATDSIYSDFMLKNKFSFYAGVPILSKWGRSIGTVCVLDFVQRSISDTQLDSLKIIAKKVFSLLEYRLRYRDNLERLIELRQLKYQGAENCRSIMYKEKLRGYAELSAGLAYRLKSQIAVVENIKKESQRMFIGGTSELNILEDSIGNISRIMNSLEAFIYAEKEQSMKPFEVNEVVKNILVSLRYKIKKNNVDVSFEEDESIITVGNSIQFSSAIYGVIMNAIEAVSESEVRKVQIKMHKEVNHMSHIDVIDTGSGVSEAIRSFIFQPFFTTKGENSLGIGLSLGDTLIHRHAGEIVLVNNSSPTIFRISFKTP